MQKIRKKNECLNEIRLILVVFKLQFKNCSHLLLEKRRKMCLHEFFFFFFSNYILRNYKEILKKTKNTISKIKIIVAIKYLNEMTTWFKLKK